MSIFVSTYMSFIGLLLPEISLEMLDIFCIFSTLHRQGGKFNESEPSPDAV